MNIDTYYIDTDCIDADCITKDCNNANFKYANCLDTDHIIKICTVPIHMIWIWIGWMIVMYIKYSWQYAKILNDIHHKIAFDYDEDTAKNMILKQELSVNICTVDTIGTI